MSFHLRAARDIPAIVYSKQTFSHREFTFQLTRVGCNVCDGKKCKEIWQEVGTRTKWLACCRRAVLQVSTYGATQAQTRVDMYVLCLCMYLCRSKVNCGCCCHKCYLGKYSVASWCSGACGATGQIYTISIHHKDKRNAANVVMANTNANKHNNNNYNDTCTCNIFQCAKLLAHTPTPTRTWLVERHAAAGILCVATCLPLFLKFLVFGTASP